MNYHQKIESFNSDMKDRGESLSNLNPPFYRLLLRAGYKLPPLVFLAFHKVAIYGCLLFSFGLIIGWFTVVVILTQFYPIIDEAIFSIEFVQNNSKMLIEAALITIGGSALFSVAFAFALKRKRKRLNLPSWENFSTANKTFKPTPKSGAV